jgi:hypothetical protein
MRHISQQISIAKSLIRKKQQQHFEIHSSVAIKVIKNARQWVQFVTKEKIWAQMLTEEKVTRHSHIVTVT